MSWWEASSVALRIPYSLLLSAVSSLWLFSRVIVVSVAGDAVPMFESEDWDIRGLSFIVSKSLTWQS